MNILATHLQDLVLANIWKSDQFSSFGEASDYHDRQYLQREQGGERNKSKKGREGETKGEGREKKSWIKKEREREREREIYIYI